MSGRRKKHKSNKSLRFLGLVLFILVGVVMVQLSNLYIQDVALEAEAMALEQQIEQAEQEYQDLKSYQAYMETDAYVEELAREKFGLIMPDEKLYKTQDE